MRLVLNLAPGTILQREKPIVCNVGVAAETSSIGDSENGIQPGQIVQPIESHCGVAMVRETAAHSQTDGNRVD